MLRSVFFRVAAIVLGLCLILGAMEYVLRIGSAILGSGGQKLPPITPGDEIRITCVGESTTYGRWPSQLEELLNEDGSATRFRVINRGDVGIRTDAVADRVDAWLDEDRPHLVITMLGINDEGNVLVYKRNAKRPWWLNEVKVIRLFVLLWRSAFDLGVPEVTAPTKVPMAEAHLDDETRATLQQLEKRRPEATRRFRYSEMIEIHRELLIEDPGTPVYHLGYLIGLVLYHESPRRIDEFFRDEIGIDPTTIDDDDRKGLIAAWVEQTGDEFAGRRLAASIANIRRDTDGERSILEGHTDDPILAGLLYLRLAAFSSRIRALEEARKHLKQADMLLPDDYQWSSLLGAIAFELEKYDIAADHFERAISLRSVLPASHEMVLLGRLANAYEQSGNIARAARLRAERDKFELHRFREFTRYHYARVIDSLQARGIPVIAMQYPLLSVASLRKLLGNRKGVLFLENRSNFEEALRTRSYREIFVDHFAGSFGHLSDDGNMLIAENVANTVRELIARNELDLGSPGSSRPPSP